MSNGFWDDITDLLGSGGPSLKQIKAMSATVKPDAMIAMSDVFDNGSNSATDNGTQLSSAIDKVIGGWRGKAADAASTSVLQTSRTSHDLGTMSSNYAQSIREYATKIQGLQHQIAAVKDVDTSFATAMKHSGGPAGLILNPGGVGQQMMKAQLQAEQHRKQAQGYLDTMNDAGSTVAPSGGAFPAQPEGRMATDAPDQLRIERHGTRAGSGRDVVTVPATRGGADHAYRAGTASTSRTSSGDAGRSTARPGTGVPQPGGHGSHGSDDTTTTSSAGDIAVGPPTSSPPIAAEPVSSGGGGLGLAGGLAAGGGALAAGAGLASRGPAFAGGRGSLGGRGGAAEGEGRSGGRVATGRGAESFDRGSAGRGAPGEPGVARPGAGEPVAARAAAFGPAAAGEAAAGRPGYLPPAGGAGGRGNEDDELNARPDYLVETDDLWGDGRLAAPPVLG